MTEHEINLIICALQDYVNKCAWLKTKTPFYSQMWDMNAATANKIIKEIKK